MFRMSKRVLQQFGTNNWEIECPPQPTWDCVLATNNLVTFHLQLVHMVPTLKAVTNILFPPWIDKNDLIFLSHHKLLTKAGFFLKLG